MFNLDLKVGISNLLPKEARDMLTRAASQPEKIRRTAVESAIAVVKSQYPLYFNKERS